MTEALVGHTFDERDEDGKPVLCLRCPGRDGQPSRCDHHRYKRRLLRFYQAHREAYDASYLDGNPQSSRNELHRLEREYKTLPPRHDCTCARRNPRTGITEYHCIECRRIGEELREVSDPVEIGRGAMVNAPMPSTLLLDLHAGYTAA